MTTCSALIIEKHTFFFKTVTLFSKMISFYICRIRKLNVFFASLFFDGYQADPFWSLRGVLLLSSVSFAAMVYVMPGLNKGIVLVYNGFRYQKNKATNNKIYWRCWRKQCKGTITTNLFHTTMERPDIRVLSISTCILSYFNFFSDPGEHKIKKKTFP